MRPLKAQLGSTPVWDDATQQYIQNPGSIWNTDYEFHLEEGTRAMLQPTIHMVSDVVQPAIDAISTKINEIIAQLRDRNPAIAFVTHETGESEVLLTPISSNWTTTFDHWPKFQFMRRGTQLNEFRLDLTPLPFIRVTVSTDGARYTIDFEHLVNADAFVGYLLIW